jgi:predicted dehydrogenase
MRLKFAFLGSWHSHSVMHVREAVEQSDELELLGMYDPDPEVIARNQARWAEYGVDIPVFETEEAVLASDAEAVVIEGHVYQNLDYAEKALAAGKHILLEKPAGVDLARFGQIQALARQQDRCLHMAYMWRYNPVISEILRLVGRGALGQVFQYRGHIPKPKSWHPELAKEFSVYKGGVYFEMAGHLVDLMVALMGEPDKVHAALAKHFGDRAEVDNAVVVHKCKNGLGIVDTTGMQVGMDRRIEVHGTGGTLLHEPLASNNLRLFLEEAVDDYPAGQWHDVEIANTPATPTLLRELAACIRGEKEPDFSMAHDLAVQRTLFAGCGITNGNALK